jgi:hypothetical protein
MPVSIPFVNHPGKRTDKGVGLTGEIAVSSIRQSNLAIRQINSGRAMHHHSFEP